MNKIIKIVLISIILFGVLLFFSILFFVAPEKIDFVKRNISEIVKFSLNENYDNKNEDIDVLKYNLDLIVHTNSKSIEEKANLQIARLNIKRDDFTLDLYDNFDIDSVLVNGIKAKYKLDDNQITITFNDSVKDTFSTTIYFTGVPQNLGFGSFDIRKKKNKIFISTLNEPVYASTWFPCNNTPNDKALLQISVTTDSNLVTVSNGLLADVEKIGKFKKFTWSTQYPIAPYLISFYSAEYKKSSHPFFYENDSMKINYYVTEEKLQNAERDFKNHSEYLKVFSDLFGEYPFIKEKYGVAEILWNGGAMESQTITGIGSRYISGLRLYESILVHELAHHWWGNSVTPNSWKDVWLNEGFATYSEALYYEKVSGKNALISTMHSFSKRIKNDGNTLYNPGRFLFSSNIYNKGAWVLHMLRRTVGDSLFFVGLKSYYKKYAYKNASTIDLKNVFEKTSKKNLTKFFEQWVFKGKVIPVLQIAYSERVNKRGIDLSINLNQTQSGYSNFHFPFDINIEDTVGNKYLFSPFIVEDTTLVYYLKAPVKKIEFDKENWLLVIIK